MKSAPLSVPYVLVSSVLRDNNEVEKRVQTPFGALAILLRKTKLNRLCVPMEMAVEINFALFDMAPRLRDDFLRNIADFALEIARDCMNLGTYLSCDIEFHLTTEARVERLTLPAGGCEWLAPGRH